MLIRLLISLLLSTYFITSPAQNFDGLNIDTVFEHSVETKLIDKSNVRIVCESCFTCRVVYLIEGLPIVQGELMPAFNTADIESIRVEKKLHTNVRLLEIFTKSNVNTGLRYIRDKTNYYTRNYPGCLITLNNKVANNSETRDQLLKLEKNDIKKIKLDEQNQVIQIKTKRRQRPRSNIREMS